jgi:hypothetical protein
MDNLKNQTISRHERNGTETSCFQFGNVCSAQTHVCKYSTNLYYCTPCQLANKLELVSRTEIAFPLTQTLRQWKYLWGHTLSDLHTVQAKQLYIINAQNTALL